MRILSIDYGDRRMGLAVCDPTGIAVTGLPTIEWDGKDVEGLFRKIAAATADYAEDSAVEKVVLGLPVRADGTDGPAALKVRAFGGRLSQALGLPVDYFDERHTTEESRAALRPTGWSGKKKKGKLDVMSAILILRGYLDAGR